ncbi:MAG TPA: hypothetical protein VJ910_11215 [Desulfuromonadales bacterium]|nr:hypothetical protein [Desulfuromonadales bacterium]
MMTAAIRTGSIVFLLFVLAGCGAPIFNLPIPAEKQLFAQGLDQYGQTGDTRILENLPQEYPGGEWSRRAEIVMQLIDEQRRQKAALAREQKSLADCQKENAYLASDNQMLESTLEQLKQLLIDMEMRAE